MIGHRRGQCNKTGEQRPGSTYCYDSCPAAGDRPLEQQHQVYLVLADTPIDLWACNLKLHQPAARSKPKAVLLPKYGGAEKQGREGAAKGRQSHFGQRGSIADVCVQFVRMGSVVATTHDDVSVLTENTLKSFC
jgi:hypothetical protein